MLNKKWGILIHYTPSHSRSGGGGLNAQFEIAYLDSKDVGARAFLTNPKIHDAIARGNFSERGDMLGKIKMGINRQESIGDWESFFPFRDVRTHSGLERIGIAQLLEYRFLQRIKEEFPFVEYIKHSITDLNRLAQVKDRKLSYENSLSYATIPLKEEMKKLREKIGRDMWKHVPPKLNSLRDRSPARIWTHQFLVRRPKTR